MNSKMSAGDNLGNELQELTSSPKDVNKKYTDYLEDEEFFMATAFLIAKKSKDPSTRVGACIVNKDGRIVSLGYNGMPRDCSDEEKFPWKKDSNDPLKNKHMYVCHAEVNAILNKNCADVKGCRIYTVLFPCNECAKVIIQCGLSEVIYMSGKNMTEIKGIASMKMFDAAGIKYRQFIPKQTKVVIDFSEIDLHPSQLLRTQSPIQGGGQGGHVPHKSNRRSKQPASRIGKVRVKK